jgi:hypothetical protein
MAKRTKSKAGKAACERSGGRFAAFRDGRKVCFKRETASASTRKKRLAALKKARKASPIAKKKRSRKGRRK